MCKQLTKAGNPCKLSGKYSGYCYRHKKTTMVGQDEEKTEDVCKICLGGLSREDCKNTSCGCTFHKDCLERWFKINNTCPLHGEEQDGQSKPIDIELTIEVTQTYRRDFIDNLIQKYIMDTVGSVAISFEKYGAHIATIYWDKPFKQMLTNAYLKDLNKTCKKLR